MNTRILHLQQITRSLWGHFTCKRSKVSGGFYRGSLRNVCRAPIQKSFTGMWRLGSGKGLHLTAAVFMCCSGMIRISTPPRHTNPPYPSPRLPHILPREAIVFPELAEMDTAGWRADAAWAPSLRSLGGHKSPGVKQAVFRVTSRHRYGN